MRIFLVMGTRPQIIKSVPIIQEAIRRGVKLQIVHTGQHYDYNVSDASLRISAIRDYDAIISKMKTIKKPYYYGGAGRRITECIIGFK